MRSPPVFFCASLPTLTAHDTPTSPGDVPGNLMTKRPTSQQPRLHFGAFLGLSFFFAPGTEPDTLWDLLRKGDPARPSTVVTDGITYNPQVMTKIDPKTGQLVYVPNAAAIPAKPRRPRNSVEKMFDQVGGSLRRIGKKLNSDLSIKGMKDFGFHMEDVSGNRDSYNDSQYLGRRGIGGSYDRTDLTVTGKVFGVVNFQTQYNNSYYTNPGANRLSFNYAAPKNRFKIDAGDITGSIQGNSLLSFNRQLKGVQASAEVVRGFRITTLMSQTKAQSRTITLQGNNGPGPYNVYTGQIVDGSEKVRVNNVEKIKGTDYTLDPYTGTLQFTPGTIIGQLDTIAVTFEVYGYNSSAGTLTGWRGDLNVLKGSRLGFSLMTQTNKAGSTTSLQKDIVGGGNAAGAELYTTQPISVTPKYDAQGNILELVPLTLKITVGGIPLVYGSDYIINPKANNRIVMKIPTTPDQNITIEYLPVIYNQTAGSRSVMGFDGFIPIGKSGSIVAEMGTSRLNLSGQNVGGGAWQIKGDMKFLKDKLQWNWAVKNIDENFTAIETPGFQRNEKGVTTGFNYTASSSLKISGTMEKTKRPSYSYSTSTITTGTSLASVAGFDDYTAKNLSANWLLGKNTTVTLSHNDSNTLLGAGGNSTLRSDTLTFGQKLKKVQFDLSFGQNSNASTFLNGTTTPTTNGLTNYATDSLTTRLNMAWQESSRFQLRGVVSSSNMNNKGAQKSTAQSMSINGDFKPWASTTFTAGIQLQDSGTFSYFNNGYTTSTTGITTGTTGRDVTPVYNSPGAGALNPYTTGYLGGGVNSGLGQGSFGPQYTSNYSNFTGGSYGGKSKTLTLGWEMRPVKTLTLSTNFSHTSSLGDLQYNSKSDNLGLTLNYNLGEKLNFFSNFTTQKMKYLGTTGGGSSTNVFAFNVNSKAIGKFITRLNYTLMRTISSTTSTSTGTTGTTLPPTYGGYNPTPTLGGTTGTTPTTGTSIYSPIGGNTNLNSYGFRVEYPIWRSNNLFFQLDHSISSGYYSAIQNTQNIGIAFSLPANMVFSLGWRTQYSNSSSSGTSQNYSYRARSIDADLQMRF